MARALQAKSDAKAAEGLHERQVAQATTTAESTECPTESADSQDSSGSDVDTPRKAEGRSPVKLPRPVQLQSLISSGPLTALALRVVHPMIFFGCVGMTCVILGVRSFLARFLRGAPTRPELQRPGASLSWEALRAAPDLIAFTRSALPVPPPLPTPPAGGLQITFGPCANLMIYTGGVAACLQRCPNYTAVFPKLRFYGVSCGAFIASSMAADVDMLQLLPAMLAWTEKFQGRLWGLVGAYSDSISSIVRGIFSDPVRFERARGRLGIGVTAFLPTPQLVRVREFHTAQDLMTTLLGSCYIPVAFETPMWCKKMGPLWDGGIFEFATQGDFVASPYVESRPDVHPKTPYLKSFSFFPPHEEDAVRIFEDGYMDCLRWLEAGAPSRFAEREVEFGSLEGGMKPLLREARSFLLAIFWPFKPKANQCGDSDAFGSGGSSGSAKSSAGPDSQ